MAITSTDINAAAQSLSTILSYMSYQGDDDYDFVISDAAATKNPGPGNLWADPANKIIATSPVIYAALTSALAVAGQKLTPWNDTTVAQHATAAGLPATAYLGGYGDVRQTIADALAHLVQLGAVVPTAAAASTAPLTLANMSKTQKVGIAVVAAGIVGAIGVGIWIVRRSSH